MDEKQLGKKAATMLESALKNQTSRFASHIQHSGKKIQDVQTKAKMKTSKRMDGNKQKYLRGIAIVLARHGFIQHFGIKPKTLRKHSERTRKKPRTTTYLFHTHYYKKGMKAQPFIDTAVTKSGVIDFISQELPKIRGEEIVLQIRKFLEN